MDLPDLHLLLLRLCPVTLTKPGGTTAPAVLPPTDQRQAWSPREPGLALVRPEMQSKVPCRPLICVCVQVPPSATDTSHLTPTLHSAAPSPAPVVLASLRLPTRPCPSSYSDLSSASSWKPALLPPARSFLASGASRLWSPLQVLLMVAFRVPSPVLRGVRWLFTFRGEEAGAGRVSTCPTSLRGHEAGWLRAGGRPEPPAPALLAAGSLLCPAVSWCPEGDVLLQKRLSRPFPGFLVHSRREATVLVLAVPLISESKVQAPPGRR